MALFSRRPKQPDNTPEEVPAAAEPVVDAPAEVVPEVKISVSTYGKQAPTAPAASKPAPARPAHLANASAEAATDAERVPGLRDNVLLRDALAALPEQAQSVELINVARQLLQGHVYIRVQGDARELLAAGKGLPTSMITFKDENYMLVYSSGMALQEALKADGDAATSALAQPTIGLLKQVVSGPMGGIAVDHASRPASALVPKQLLEKAVADLDPELRIKTLLAGPRTDETTERVVAALGEAPLWIAARKSDDGAVGIAELRTPDGQRMLELFSHPLELLALGRGDQPVKVDAAQVAAALRGDTALNGVVVDPAGPWIRIPRDKLHTLLAVGA